ncbi:MAG: hypothetical protein AD742_20675 [Methylibium sp. NZG]|nr:MAG: hypothetical protein AD742_20675 [Methylibium sp. NZG]
MSMNLTRWPRLAGACLALCVLSACATYGPPKLAPGASVADATRALGAPTGEYALPAGAKRLEFARGPFGKHTYMLDFDAQQRLLGWTQVLTEARFNAVRAGTPKGDVLLALGRPSETSRIALQRQTVWSYRFEDHFCRWFQVGIDEAGRVTDTGYFPDPMCEPKDPGDLVSRLVR